MTRVSETIDVDRPIRAVYDQWTQFEDFPQFMAGVDEVRQLDDSHLHWTASIGGVTREWDAVIVEQDPDRIVSWASTEGATNRGAVTFTPVQGGRTRVDLELEFEPEGLVETAGDKLGLVEGRAKGDLERFKEFIEDRTTPTGEWRGRIEGGAPIDRGDGAPTSKRGPLSS